MIISALNEGENDNRVSITPTMAKLYIKSGLEVSIETNAGQKSGFSNKDYEIAGAVVINDRKTLLQDTNILLCVDEPLVPELKGLPAEALLIGQIDNAPQSSLLKWCLKYRISVFSMNLIPRISRAQSMDTLSSQANLAGYRAVLEAVNHFKRALPMMMTAAGMIHPAKVFVVGAGVAGLQAIATAKRLGAVVFAFDIRKSAKEQVESLGAEFIEVTGIEDAETNAGYTREVGEEYKSLQAELIHQYTIIADIVICTALVPGEKAPVLLKATTVEQMKKGSVIVDLAALHGGNCELTERDAIIYHSEVTIIGYSNMAGFVSTTASELYANNLFNLVHFLLGTPPNLQFNEQDEIIQQGMLCHDGQYLPFQYVKE